VTTNSTEAEPEAVETSDGEYDIESIRQEWVGRVVASSTGRYPVEYDAIRRYCHMVRDTNPLFLDREAAAAGPYGEIIVPPPMIPNFAGNGTWPRKEKSSGKRPGFTHGIPTPGSLGIMMNIAWKYLAPVRVGDHLHAQTVIADVFCKAIKLDPLAVWIVTRTDIFNQHDELVAQGTNTVLTHRSPREVKGDNQ
jgi:acyl dehydratase